MTTKSIHPPTTTGWRRKSLSSPPLSPNRVNNYHKAHTAFLALSFIHYLRRRGGGIQKISRLLDDTGGPKAKSE